LRIGDALRGNDRAAHGEILEAVAAAATLKVAQERPQGFGEAMTASSPKSERHNI
jgi:hypothetical protein